MPSMRRTISATLKAMAWWSARRLPNVSRTLKFKLKEQSNAPHGGGRERGPEVRQPPTTAGGRRVFSHSTAAPSVISLVYINRPTLMKRMAWRHKVLPHCYRPLLLLLLLRFRPGDLDEAHGVLEACAREAVRGEHAEHPLVVELVRRRRSS